MATQPGGVLLHLRGKCQCNVTLNFKPKLAFTENEDHSMHHRVPQNHQVAPLSLKMYILVTQDIWSHIVDANPNAGHP